MAKSKDEQIRDEIEQLEFIYNTKTNLTNEILQVIMPVVLFLTGVIVGKKLIYDMLTAGAYLMVMIITFYAITGALNRGRNNHTIC